MMLMSVMISSCVIAYAFTSRQATLPLRQMKHQSTPCVGISQSDRLRPIYSSTSYTTFGKSSSTQLYAVNDYDISVETSEDDKDEGVDDNSFDESEPHIDDDDDDDDDIITQKLRRNAQNGPINPMKELDKMAKENQDEALNSSDIEVTVSAVNTTNAASTSTDTNGSELLVAKTSSLYSYLMANNMHPEFDPDVSHDEEYLEEQFKELLSRKGSELSRLGPGIATLPLDPYSEEAKVEGNLAKKEVALQQVIEQLKPNNEQEWDREKLEEAHRLKMEIDQMHADDCGAVLLANLAFYEAFSARDDEWMNDVWWHSPSVICIHPSHPPLIGSTAVLESFKTMFLNGMKGSSRSSGRSAAANMGGYMTPANIRGLSVRGTTASLVCDEEVNAKSYDRSGNSGGVMVNKLLTTNVFRKIGGKWKMVHRHSSWHPETLAAQAAMKAKPGMVDNDTKKDDKKPPTFINDSLTKKRKGMTLRKLNGGTSRRPIGSPTIPSSLEGLDVNAVLGIPGRDEEDTRPKKAKVSSEDDFLKKLLGLGEDDDGEKDGDEDASSATSVGDALADLLGGKAQSDTTHTTGSGTPEDPFVTRRVIQLGPEDLKKLKGNSNIVGDGGSEQDADFVDDEDSEDDDDDDSTDIVVDLRGKSEGERKELLSKIVGHVIKDTSDATIDDNTPQSSTVDVSASPYIKPKQLSPTQKCISTIRRLSEQGLLSSNQKRILLTNIIASSAKGETSMVQVAYELLCTDDEDAAHDDSNQTVEGDLAGMEDFTEQCIVFATSAEEADF